MAINHAVFSSWHRQVNIGISHSITFSLYFENEMKDIYYRACHQITKLFSRRIEVISADFCHFSTTS